MKAKRRRPRKPRYNPMLGFYCGRANERPTTADVDAALKKAYERLPAMLAHTSTLYSRMRGGKTTLGVMATRAAAKQGKRTVHVAATPEGMQGVISEHIRQHKAALEERHLAQHVVTLAEGETPGYTHRTMWAREGVQLDDLPNHTVVAWVVEGTLPAGDALGAVLGQAAGLPLPPGVTVYQIIGPLKRNSPAPGAVTEY